MKNSFILFQNYREYFEDLTGDEAKELLFAIFDYEKTRVKPVNLSAKVGCYFLVIKQQLDKNYEEYLKIADKNKENGAKGGRPKKTQNNPKNPMGYLETQKTQPNPKNLDIDNDIDIDNGSDIDIDKDNTKENVKKKSAKSTKTQNKFVKPTKEEVLQYAKEQKLRTDCIDDFIDHYESNGWRVGKAGLPMRSWEASYRKWCRSDYNQPKNKGNPFLEMLKEKYPEEVNNIFPDNVVDTEGVEQ